MTADFPGNRDQQPVRTADDRRQEQVFEQLSWEQVLAREGRDRVPAHPLKSAAQVKNNLIDPLARAND